MKFDPFKWQQVKPNEKIKAPQGLLHVMCSEKSVVYVECEGVEAIAGVGNETIVKIAQDFFYTVKAPDGADVYVYCPFDNFHTPTGEVFTNIDRKPTESGTMLEVTKALRRFELERRQERREHLEKMRAISRPKVAEPELIPDEDLAQDREFVPGKDETPSETDT